MKKIYSEKDLKEVLGQNVKARRVKKGLNQEQLAERADVSKNTISVIETGQKFVHAKTLILLADALETEIYELLKPEYVYPDKAEDLILRFSAQVRDAIDQVEDRYMGSGCAVPPQSAEKRR